MHSLECLSSSLLTDTTEGFGFTSYKDIERCLRALATRSIAESETVPASSEQLDILYGVLDKFRLNEAIIGPALSMLCRSQQETAAAVLDRRLASALEFYSSFLTNENVRLLSVAALRELDSRLLTRIPGVIFNVLLDDSEDIRSQGCELICPLIGHCRPRNLFTSLRSFVGLVGRDVFIKYLREQNATTATATAEANVPTSLVLFEQEPLNAFIDPRWLEYNFN